MKHIILLFMSVAALCTAFYEHHIQKAHFNEKTETYYSWQKELKIVEDNVKFLKENQPQLNFLIKRGWLSPQSRLVGGGCINQWAASLNGVRFRVEPETIKEMKEGYAFKVSKIVIEIDALLDNHIYEFSENILKNFPGILVLRKLSVRRNEKVNEIDPLDTKQNKRPNFVTGELIFEWFAMGAKKDEE
ncbi:MAG: hypothetical protein H0X26_01130 [Alphaproteobacteria bacterium]|nr:hypothetical protein [Alphaproteobacteria bacterium]